MYILYFNVYVATWNEIFISCDQWKWILSDLMWPLSQKLWPFWYSSCNCFISLRVYRFNDINDVIVRNDVELVISFWVKKIYEIERKDNISDSFWWCLIYFRARVRNTGGYLRRPEIRTIIFFLFRLEILITCQNPKMAQLFSSEKPKMAQNSDNLCLEFHFSSNYGPSRFDTWFIFRVEIKEKLNCSNFGLSQDFMHMPSCVSICFEDFFGLLREPPVWYFIYHTLLQYPFGTRYMAIPYW